MDWARAKSILIFIFVLLNLFLSIMMISSFNSDNVSDEAIKNTYKVLEDRGIIVKCDIPVYNKQIGTLISSNTLLDKDLIIKGFFGDEKYTERNSNESTVADCGNRKLLISKVNTFVYSNSNPQETIDFADSKRVQNYLVNLFKRLNVPFENFYFDSMEDLPDSKRRYVFREKKDGFWLYSNYVDIIIAKDGITYLKYNNKNVDEITKGQKIMPAYQILIKNLINNSGMVIKEINIGFGEQNIGKDTKVLDDLPVWRVILQKDEKIEERYFKVYNGEEVKLNVK